MIQLSVELNQSINQSINQASKQASKQASNQAVNQSINQHWMLHACMVVMRGLHIDPWMVRLTGACNARFRLCKTCGPDVIIQDF